MNSCVGWVVCVLMSVATSSAATFTVTTNADGGPGSLRQAMLDANSNSGIADTVVFNIGGTPPFTIALLTSLPQLVYPNVALNANTQPGYGLTNPAIRLVPAVGGTANTNAVLVSNTSNCVFRGFHISGFTNVAAISLNGHGHNVVAGNMLIHNGDGVYVSGGQSNVIGGLLASERNVISSNTDIGVRIEGVACSNSLIAGNFIGTSPDGLSAWPNRLTGIYLHNCPRFTVRGSAAAPQVISGNGNGGIGLNGPGTVGDLIVGNLIGVDVSGTQALANVTSGVSIDGAVGTTIGGTNAGERNVISGNTEYGILLSNGSYSNVVQANFIGLASNGQAIVSNRYSGVQIDQASNNTIGVAGGGNYIGGNVGSGVGINGTNAANNALYGNIIGMGVASNSAPNLNCAVYVFEARGTKIGGPAAGQGNTIVNHPGDGIFITGSNAQQNVILQNLIGVDAAGIARPNAGNGVRLDGSPSNVVGSIVGSGRNVISGNGGAGVWMLNGASGCQVLVNYIGLAPSGTSAVPNGFSGVRVSDTRGAAIGGTFGVPNVISGNSYAGVRIDGNSSNTVVAGNYIGTTAAGNAPLPNIGDGINLASTGVRIGGKLSTERNIISGNSVNGIAAGAGSDDCQILGNYIGLDHLGLTTVSNSQYGVYLVGSPRAIIGGGASGGRNVIASSRLEGLYLDTGMSNTVVAGNFIGTDATGTNARPNSAGIKVNSDAVTIGGTNSGDGNVISGNANRGLHLVGGNGVRVFGNYIGITAVGDGALPNYYGIHVDPFAGPVTIGGTNEGEGNVVSRNVTDEIQIRGPSGGHRVAGNYLGLRFDGGSFGSIDYGAGVSSINSASNMIAANAIAQCYYGVLLSGTGSMANVVRGNLIGTEYDGVTPSGHLIAGIGIENASSNVIGGLAAGEGNTIAFSGAGVTVTNAGGTNALGNLIVANLIFSNSPGLSVDLGQDGATANDAGDGDTGPNGRQNLPIITNCFRAATNIVFVQGILTSAPSRVYAIDIYRAPGTNAASVLYLGRTTALSDGGGIATFSAGFAATVPTGAFLSATATDAGLNTSEYGLSTRSVTNGLGDSDGDRIPDYWESLYGLNPAVSNAVGADADGDGYSDLSEYIADTAANSSSAFPAITVISNGTSRFVTFPSSAARMYQLQFNDALATNPVWSAVGAFSAGSGVVTTLPDPAIATSRAYRVSIKLP